MSDDWDPVLPPGPAIQKKPAENQVVVKPVMLGSSPQAQVPVEDEGRVNEPWDPPQLPSGNQTGTATRKDIEEQAYSSQTQEPIFTQPITLPLGWLGGVWLAGLLLAGLMGWFLLAQILSVIQTLMQLPWGLQVPGWGLVGFFTVIVAYPLVRLYQAYRRLPPVQQIKMTVVHAAGASEPQLRAARATIKAYLREYRLDSEVLRRELKQVGLADAELQAMQTHKDNLLQQSPKTTKDWLEEFEQGFLGPLDAAVNARIERYSRMVAIKTAISPNALIDMAVVLYNGFSLLRDICTLYQVRAGRLGMVYLFGLVLFQGYIAGQVQDNLEVLEGGLQALCESMLDAVGAKIVGMAGARAAEAILHLLFLRRIGKGMMKRLRPLG